jgi:hypothetical protein
MPFHIVKSHVGSQHGFIPRIEISFCIVKNNMQVIDINGF